MATIQTLKVHFSSQYADIPQYFAKIFSIIPQRSRPTRAARFTYNPDLRLLNYRLVNTPIGESSLNDSRGLGSAPALNDFRSGLLARVRWQLRVVLRICHRFFHMDNPVS